MRAVIQRVKEARVSVNGNVKGAIKKGLLVYLGIEKNDTEADIEYIASKLAALRLFENEEGKMNLDITEAGGDFLVVSQFTLLGDLRKGRRPSFDKAEWPDKARELYKAFLNNLRGKSVRVEEGEFQAHMEVESINDGPVTFLLDSKKIF